MLGENIYWLYVDTMQPRRHLILLIASDAGGPQMP
jgi:hypothetical protein